MKSLVFLLLCVFGMSSLHADDSAYYAMYRNAKSSYQVEKEFVVMLKPSNPDELRTAGYIKYSVTLLLDDKSASKELDAKIDIVRSVIIDTTSGFVQTDLQSTAGKQKLGMSLTASINAILTHSSILGVTFPDLVIQPGR